MFTGIIEAVGTVESADPQEENILFTVRSELGRELKPDQSVSHNGACLTVTAADGDRHQAVAVAETLQKTNLARLKPGDQINLERSLTLRQRLDGHLVQGHVDATGKCIGREEKGGSVEFRFRFPDRFSSLLIEKGSIAINGISLTAFKVTRDAFSIAVIPYTYEHTTLHLLKTGDTVNLEFDLIGKYIARMQETGR